MGQNLGGGQGISGCLWAFGGVLAFGRKCRGAQSEKIIKGRIYCIWVFSFFVVPIAPGRFHAGGQRGFVRPVKFAGRQAVVMFIKAGHAGHVPFAPQNAGF